MQSQRMYDIVVLSFALLTLGSPARAQSLCTESRTDSKFRGAQIFGA